MKKRFLGNTGMAVSEIAFGGVEIGIPYGIGVQSEKDMLGEKEAIQLSHKSLEEGLNFFDTARMYGSSEEIIGKAFKDRRKEVVIGSKCRHFLDADGKMPSGHALKDTIHKSLQDSLAALQTDYLDVFMLHQGDLQILQNHEVSKVFTDLKQEGMVRAIGVSTYSWEETQMALDTGIWEVLQLPFNLMDQRQATLFDLAKEKGVGVVIRSVLLKGLLSNRGKNLPEPLQPIEKHIESYAALITNNQVDLPGLAIKFALSFDQVASVLVGIDKLSYLQQAVHSANGNYLNASTLKMAKSLAYPDPAFINLNYWSKMGWLP